MRQDVLKRFGCHKSRPEGCHNVPRGRTACMDKVATVVEALNEHGRGREAHEPDLHGVRSSKLGIVFSSLLNRVPVFLAFKFLSVEALYCYNVCKCVLGTCGGFLVLRLLSLYAALHAGRDQCQNDGGHRNPCQRDQSKLPRVVECQSQRSKCLDYIIDGEAERLRSANLELTNLPKTGMSETLDIVLREPYVCKRDSKDATPDVRDSYQPRSFSRRFWNSSSRTPLACNSPKISHVVK